MSDPKNKRSSIGYSKADDKIIKEHVAANPGNKQAAFKSAAAIIARKWTSISAHYYAQLVKSKKNKPNATSIPTLTTTHEPQVRVIRRAKKGYPEQEIDLGEVALSLIIPKLSQKAKASLIRKLLA